jgi:ferredoxin
MNRQNTPLADRPPTLRRPREVSVEQVLAGNRRDRAAVPHPRLPAALTHAGLPVPAGCREGVRGSCELTVLEGEPEHRDDPGAAPGRMHACVSRSLSSRLVIDL